MKYDYSTKDSSHYYDPNHYLLRKSEDNAIRVGIIREEREGSDGSTRYIVEVTKEGKQIPLSCICLTRFGGVHNFEEFRLRPWLQDVAAGNLSAPAAAATYDLRSGDQVVVANLGGQGREGIILGGIRHAARAESTERGDISYHSCFQGLETTISSAGAWKVQFNGVPVNTVQLDLPPLGTAAPPPQFDPLIAGSYIEFDDSGNFTLTDGSQEIKMNKDPTSGSIEIVSGGNTITIGGTAAAPEISIATGSFSVEGSMDISFATSTGDFSTESLTANIKAQQITIGNGSVELLALIAELVDAIGGVFTTSPVGPNSPLNGSPLWAQVELAKAKLAAITG